MFPFNCIDDDLAFANCLYILLHSDKLNVEFFKNTKQLNLINNFVALGKDIDHLDPIKIFLKLTVNHVVIIWIMSLTILS